MSFAWMLIALGTIPHDGGVIRESVDVIERNRYYDDCGKQVFEQVIFYAWTRDHYEIIAWRLVKDATLVPVKTGGRFAVLWWDGGKLRQVVADSMRDTYSQTDPEQEAREWLPSEQRKGLRR